MSYTAVKLIAPDSLNSFASESSWRNRNVPNNKKRVQNNYPKIKIRTKCFQRIDIKRKKKVFSVYKEMTSEVTIELKLSFQTNTNERTYDNESAKSGRSDTPTSFSVHHKGYFFRIFVDWFTKFEVVINLFILRVLSQTITTKTHTHTCIHTYTHT